MATLGKRVTFGADAFVDIAARVVIHDNATCGHRVIAQGQHSYEQRTEAAHSRIATCELAPPIFGRSADNRRVGDKRQHDRYPIWALGRLWWNLDSEPIQVRVADLSLGGAAIEMDGPIGSDRFHIQFGLGALQQPFPMTVVAGASTWHGTMLHARFDDLHATQRAMLEALIEQWQGQYNARIGRTLFGGGSAA
jgi:hypothetical protein